VLTIGATNLAQELDQALLRPGRFEVVYEIPSPGPTARMDILKYHSRCAARCWGVARRCVLPSAGQGLVFLAGRAAEGRFLVWSEN